MPLYIKSLIVILALATFVFYFIKTPAGQIIGSDNFRRKKNLWFILTLVAFLSHNFWIYSGLTALMIFVANKRDIGKASLFLFLLFAVPLGGTSIPGFGVVNYLFDLNHQRLLSICIFLPVLIRFSRTRNTQPLISNVMDLMIYAYIILTIVLTFRGTTFTDTLRFAFYQFIDIYLPYFVVSRTLVDIDDFKEAMFSYVTVALILSVIGVFEMLKHWHLYSALEINLGIAKSGEYLERSGLLRAQASLRRIPLGYVIAIAIGFHFFLRQYFPSKRIWNMGMLVLLAGLIAPLSRGPWVGATILVMVYVLLSDNKFRSITYLLVFSGLFMLLASLTPFGSTLFGLIPYIGDIEAGNISYRERLLENSWPVILRNPLLGSIDYLETPEMQALIQGQGIIDIVNTYLRVGLNYGLLGLSLFAGVFTVACWKVFGCFRNSRLITPEEKILGHSLLATMLCIMATIFTVSSVSAIPVMYWIVASMCSAYVKMIHLKRSTIASSKITED